MFTQPRIANLRQAFSELTDAELASLVIEFVGPDGAGLPLGEEIYRRLTASQQPIVIPGWRRPVSAPAPTLSRR